MTFNSDSQGLVDCDCVALIYSSFLIIKLIIIKSYSSYSPNNETNKSEAIKNIIKNKKPDCFIVKNLLLKNKLNCHIVYI